MTCSPSGSSQEFNPSRSDVVQLESSSIDNTFLTPPITPRSEKDVPFKPSDADRISLSMKRSQGNRHYRSSVPRLIRAYASTDEATMTGEIPQIFDDNTLAHSKSMPSLYTWSDRSPQKHGDMVTKHTRHQSIHSRPRRWTLPDKAGSTRGFTTLKPMFKYTTAADSTKPGQSPAMITLRRATAKASRQTNITFFPPPTFSRNKGSFMSCFAKTVIGENEDTTENLDFLANQVGHEDRKRSVCIAFGTARPAVGVIAEALVTQMASNGSFIDTNQSDQVRRCSAQDGCGVTPYEVIWDEETTPSSKSDSSSPLALVCGQPQNTAALTDRRRSVAVDKLEMQISKAIAQSRRGSHIATRDEMYGLRRASFQNWINDRFSKFFHDAALQNLPRSRKSKSPGSSKSVSVPVESAVHQTLDERRMSVNGEDDFFPPVWSCTGTGEIGWEQVVHQDSTNKQADVVAETVRPRIGSMVGVSSHLRRRCTVARGSQQRNTSKESTRRRKSSVYIGPHVIAETTPLLTSAG